MKRCENRQHNLSEQINFNLDKYLEDIAKLETVEILMNYLNVNVESQDHKWLMKYHYKELYNKFSSLNPTKEDLDRIISNVKNPKCAVVIQRKLFQTFRY